jgi:hypothetical protein
MQGKPEGENCILTKRTPVTNKLYRLKVVELIIIELEIKLRNVPPYNSIATLNRFSFQVRVRGFH